MFRYGCGLFRGGMYGGGWFMMLIPILITGIIAYLVFKMINNNHKSHDNRIDDNTNALMILNEKFAKGEIKEDEYLRKRKIIKK